MTEKREKNKCEYSSFMLLEKVCDRVDIKTMLKMYAGNVTKFGKSKARVRECRGGNEFRCSRGV